MIFIIQALKSYKNSKILQESVCNTIHHLLEYMESPIKDLVLIVNPSLTGVDFGSLVRADLLPSTGFKMDFLIK